MGEQQMPQVLVIKHLGWWDSPQSARRPHPEQEQPRAELQT